MPDRAESVVLKRFPDELSALLLIGNLRSQGIHAVSVGGLTAQLRAEAPSTVAVLVRTEDLALAQEIVAELESPEVLVEADSDDPSSDGESPEEGASDEPPFWEIEDDGAEDEWDATQDGRGACDDRDGDGEPR
ncbi:MAG: hypothetical protein RI967_2426 [Planctomycetota bacterium]|jgi:hypothetical protein